MSDMVVQFERILSFFDLPYIGDVLVTCDRTCGRVLGRPGVCVCNLTSNLPDGPVQSHVDLYSREVRRRTGTG